MKNVEYLGHSDGKHYGAATVGDVRYPLNVKIEVSNDRAAQVEALDPEWPHDFDVTDADGTGLKRPRKTGDDEQPPVGQDAIGGGVNLGDNPDTLPPTT